MLCSGNFCLFSCLKYKWLLRKQILPRAGSELSFAYTITMFRWKERVRATMKSKANNSQVLGVIRCTELIRRMQFPLLFITSVLHLWFSWVTLEKLSFTLLQCPGGDHIINRVYYLMFIMTNTLIIKKITCFITCFEQCYAKPCLCFPSSIVLAIFITCLRSDDWKVSIWQNLSLTFISIPEHLAVGKVCWTNLQLPELQTLPLSRKSGSQQWPLGQAIPRPILYVES